MYELNETIVAISSPSSGQRVIVRITGSDTIPVCNRIFAKDTRQQTSGNDAGVVSVPVGAKSRTTDARRETSLLDGNIAIDAELKADAKLYLFLAPHSYTGDDVAEIHMHTNPAVTKTLMDNLLGKGLRMAGPGEFTARAYLNGKIDLAQAEAVNEIVISSNKFQLAAAEKLLAGRLAETTAKLRASLMEALSLIETGLDFSGEDIEFITRPEAVERLVEIKDQLEQLLSGTIRRESVIDLPAVGVGGAPNAGKSRLVNKLLGKERSIVSHRRKTTRDVLTGLLTLAHCRCVLFDCAGLTCGSLLPCFREDKLAPAEAGACRSGHERRTILDELAQQAAIEALRNSAVVVFCVDISKGPRRKTQKGRDFDLWAEEIDLWSLVRSLGTPALIPVVTKCDLLSEEVLSDRLAELSKLFGPAPKSTPADRFSSMDNKSEHNKVGFGAGFLATSTETGTGIELLRETVDKKIIEMAFGSVAAQSLALPFSSVWQTPVALTARHRQCAGEAIANISESINELQAGNDEVTAMMLRAAYQGICDIEFATGGAGQVDEQILKKIFARFCIGK